MDDQTPTLQIDLLALTTDLITAYVSNNSVPASELPIVMAKVHAALSGLGIPTSPEPPKIKTPTPAEIRKSITPEHLISFEDGKPYKTLRRHLNLRGLSPETYREKWGLPADYPMTSAAYSTQRSELARTLGLGQQRRKSPAAVADDEQTQIETPPAKRRGRPPKAAETVEAVEAMDTPADAEA